ncbi:alanyl-tRNA editing protein [Octadecabacter sp. 1_MG-2023]|uniref:alanyl-tRNA editing protein n=1 Tax=unclassified Octadecabacter TaxID=196158 RepID=UPI001C09BFA9|nr:MULTISPECIES: alanyl-tRNA editing protein [unclassified Octadecabacter]MBU2993125.1 alanyl-tRNA editing protein [Octadecabacter sp. B2R22]MDO6733423.1 alanyl-tRNA editing protein [Octadecabacter sp. 1_MG-2023]
MSKPLFIDDAYKRDASAEVFAVTDEGGIILDETIFYPTGGGQPGDSGTLTWEGGKIDIATAVKGDGGSIILVPAEPNPLPPVGSKVTQTLDWERRHHHMRVHTALHLLSVVIPLPVTGGSIGVDKGRLDFDMPEAPEDKAELEATLNKLIACDFEISTEWITDAELAANPGLVKTMSVQPPKGAGRVRLVRIGEGENTADLQPCGGTHVRYTSEIGTVRLGKVEKKGKQNRRVYLHLET